MDKHEIMSVPDHMRESISNIPESSGIYKFLDKEGHLLYIGKSKNLKKRVTSYFRKQGKDTRKRTLRFIFHIHQIEFIQTKTELEALILEDNLIKQSLPQYNIKQKKFREQVYIVVTTDVFPAIKITKNEEIEFLDHLFGPFKDKYAAGYILLIINKILKLRSCSDPTPINKCMLFGIDKCLGPCMKNISEEEYYKIVQVAIEFLKGNPDPILEIISEQINKVVRKMNFEEATILRDINKFCLNFCKRQKFISDFMRGNMVIKSSLINRIFLFQKGDLIKIYQRKPTDKIIKNCFQIRKNNNTLNSHLLMDRAYVVWVWMKQNNGEAKIC